MNSESLILLSASAFDSSSATEFSLARASVYIFSCFVTFLSSRLLTTVNPADNKPKTVATPASAGLATIPKTVKAVSRVADDSLAESEPRPTTEMCVRVCVLLYFLRPVCSGRLHWIALFADQRFFWRRKSSALICVISCIG